MKAALINSQNTVENIIVWNDGDVWAGTERVVVLQDSDSVGVGFTYNGGTSFTKPEVPEVPDTKSYKFKRLAEYPPTAEQLDTIFHEGLDVWKEQIQAIKDKYPKEVE